MAQQSRYGRPQLENFLRPWAIHVDYGMFQSQSTDTTPVLIYHPLGHFDYIYLVVLHAGTRIFDT